MATHPHVLIATPLGRNGKGGIDRIMDALRNELARAPADDLSVQFGTTRGPGSLWLSPFYMAAFLMRMALLRLIGRCDLVHINLSVSGSTERKLVVASTAKALGIPYVLHLHGAQYPAYVAGVSSKLRGRINELFVSASTVIVLGNFWKQFVTEELGVSPDRAKILPNAVPRPAIEKSPMAVQGKVQVLFLGELGVRKGVPQLIDALNRIGNREQWRATLAGNGKVAETRTQISELGLDDNVCVPGWVGPDEAAKLLSESDVLVLPSLAENLPMSVIEGMAAGLAVVTTPVGAVSDIIEHGKTGLLVPPGDAEALKQALDIIISDQGLRSRLGSAAEQFHRQHLDIVPYARALVKIWRSAL